jgi:hypothetical protein
MSTAPPGISAAFSLSLSAPNFGPVAVAKFRLFPPFLLLIATFQCLFFLLLTTDFVSSTAFDPQFYAPPDSTQVSLSCLYVERCPTVYRSQRPAGGRRRRPNPPFDSFLAHLLPYKPASGWRRRSWRRRPSKTKPMSRTPQPTGLSPAGIPERESWGESRPGVRVTAPDRLGVRDTAIKDQRGRVER